MDKPTIDEERAVARIIAHEKDELVEAARALCDQLSVVHNDYRYHGVWAHWTVHHGQYQGPTYTDEFLHLQKVLDEVSPETAAYQEAFPPEGPA